MLMGQKNEIFHGLISKESQKSRLDLAYGMELPRPQSLPYLRLCRHCCLRGRGEGGDVVHRSVCCATKPAHPLGAVCVQ